MSALGVTAWFCLGIAPKIPPCGAAGDKDTDAEKHSKATGHGTTSGTQRGAVVVARAFEEQA